MSIHHPDLYTPFEHHWRAHSFLHWYIGICTGTLNSVCARSHSSYDRLPCLSSRISTVRYFVISWRTTRSHLSGNLKQSSSGEVLKSMTDSCDHSDRSRHLSESVTVWCELKRFYCPALFCSDLQQQPCETDPAVLILFRGCSKPIRDGQGNDVIVGSVMAALEHQVSTQRKQLPICPL